ncbi:MAG: glycine zipper 2TM domain-containing protein [Magnetovibrio sp.]|nr:glycine zipper 2TM domain-containing protein [Magnetovibrio sp.]
MKTKLLSIIAAAFLLAGLPTQKASASDSQIFGTVIGAATGGFIGSNIGGGRGQLAATAAGTLIGAMIGHEMGTAADNRRRYETIYEPVYEPVYQPSYEPVYVPAPPAPKRKVVIHKKTVIVKHIHHGAADVHHSKHWKKNKKWRKRAWEKRRRKLARTCYEQPRRCSKAF